MAIETKRHDGFIEFHAATPVSADEVIEVVREAYSTNPSSLVLWRFDPRTLHDLSANRFGDIVREMNRFLEARGPEARTAIVAANDGDLLLVKAFLATVEALASLPVRAFMNRDSAVRWLGGAAA